MNDYPSRPASNSLVVAEKNAHRPGGCVGIFFKLFEWNRRVAKNTLFPKKLLAPARGNHKFNVDENPPKAKHLLAPCLNGCGISSMKKNGKLHSELKQPMRSPSLVARLMGLESIPVDSHTPFSEKHYTKKTKQGTRLEIQPQKIGKRRSVSRFGADALQIRNVLSRSRKRKAKLASPVKSPRAAKTTSKLMGAATRILEPGLQAPSRAKCALTYPDSLAKPMNVEVRDQAKTVIRLPAQLFNPHVLKTQTSCRNCGHGIETMDLESDAFEQSLMLNSEQQPPRIVLQGLGRSECTHPCHQPESPRGCFHSAVFNVTHEDRQRLARQCERGGRVVLLRPDALQAQGNVISGAHHQPAISNGQSHRDLLRNSFVHDHSCASSSAHSHPPMAIREDRVPTRLNCTNEHSRKVPTKDFITLNRNLSQPFVGSPRKPCSYDELCRYAESLGSSSSKRGLSGKTTYPACVRSRPVDQGGNVGSGSKDIGVVLSSFNSALSSKSDMEDPGMDHCSFGKGNRDALGPMLEQKLKELTSQAEYELATVAQGRTTASILQELISALTAERPISPDLNSTVTPRSSQAEAGAKSLSMRLCGDRFSPGSILDAAFSNDSCVSSSIDDSLDHLESSRSVNNRETSNSVVPVTHLLNHISRILDRGDVKLSTHYSSYKREVLLNAELLFGKADGLFVDFLLGPFLGELETLAVAAWRSTVVYGIQLSNGETENPLRRFLLACLVECLSVRYDRYINCGFRAWCELPRPTDPEALIQVFDTEVRRWASMAHRSPYEIIDLEMSTSLGKWTDFEIEEFETGGEIGQIIFQGLLGEIIADILS